MGCLGLNGAGKTTLIRLVLGLLIPLEETPRSSASTLSATPWRRPTTCLCPGKPISGPPSASPRRYVTRAGPGSRYASYQSELTNRFDLDVTKRVRALSKGNRQKVILIAALMTRADYSSWTSQRAASTH